MKKKKSIKKKNKRRKRAVNITRNDDLDEIWVHRFAINF
jgi:hypothetical protein